MIVGWLLACSPRSGLVTADDSSVLTVDSGTTDETGHTGETGGETGATETGDPPEPESMCTLSLTCKGPIQDDPPVACAFTVTSADGRVDYEGPAVAEKRGRSSQDFPKPQYALELQDEAGAEDGNDLQDMGGESDWILNGAWIDRSFMRNRLLFESFQALGGNERYATETRFCELTLDGDYVGVYLLGEEIKRDDDRLDLTADDGTGSTFILKQDDDGAFYDLTSANGVWQLVYPNDDDITTQQAEGIRATLDTWEAILAGKEEQSLWTVVDMASAVDFVLLEELAKNNDAYYLSMHVWRDAGGLVHFTPWDFDLSFGQPSYNNSEPPEAWILYRPLFVSAMAADPAFQKALGERWRELRAGEWSEDVLRGRIDGYVSLIDEAAARNWKRWDIEDVDFLGEDIYAVKSWEDEVDHVKAWIHERLLWMDDNVDDYAAGN